MTTAFTATTPAPDGQPHPDGPAGPHHDVSGQVTDRLDTLLVDLAKEDSSDTGSGRPDGIGHEVDDTDDEDHPLTGRHRAASSPLRRAARTAAWVSAGLLVAALLGWAAAAMMGLTGPDDLASGAAGGARAFPVEQVDPADRTFERIVEVTGKPPRSDESPTSAPGTTVEPAPVSGPVTSPAKPSSPAPSPRPTPTPVPTVSAGDPCPAEGQTGVTDTGRAVVCTSPGNGRTRWRHT